MQLFRAFRLEQEQPQQAYRLLARDTVGLMARYVKWTEIRVVDVGGGPGYLEEALAREGAACITVDADPAEMRLHGRTPNHAVVADGLRLPFADGRFDVAHSSNVLEHVQDPWPLLDEMLRVLRPGGLAFVFFTNWWSPHGGHETSPWHYLGGDRAARRFERRHGAAPKNRFGQSLFALGVGDVLRWARQDPDVDIVDAFPRYYPRWTKGLVRVPGVRELVTWNLGVVLRRRW